SRPCTSRRWPSAAATAIRRSISTPLRDRPRSSRRSPRRTRSLPSCRRAGVPAHWTGCSSATCSRMPSGAWSADGGLPMAFDELKPIFDRDGYVIVRPFLAPADFAELTANLDRYIRTVVPTLPDKHAFYMDKARPETLKQLQHMDLDPYLRDYVRHPAWLALARALLGEEAEGQAPEWFNKPPGPESPTPPHQDNYYFNLKPPNVLTVWLALDQVDAGNGCLRYVPGSHRRGLRPHGRSNVLGFSQGIAD